MDKIRFSVDFNALAVCLTAVFATLKILGIISWSWLIVFLPLLLVYGLGALVVIIATIWFLIYMTIKKQ